MAKGCVLSTGYLPRGGLPRNSVDRITDRPDMTSAVDRGRKASNQTNKQLDLMFMKHYAPNRCLYIKVAKLRTGVGSGVQRHHTYKIAVSNYSKNTSKSKSSKGDNSKKIK